MFIIKDRRQALDPCSTVLIGPSVNQQADNDWDFPLSATLSLTENNTGRAAWSMSRIHKEKIRREGECRGYPGEPDCGGKTYWEFGRSRLTSSVVCNQSTAERWRPQHCPYWSLRSVWGSPEEHEEPWEGQCYGAQEHVCQQHCTPSAIK